MLSKVTVSLIVSSADHVTLFVVVSLIVGSVVGGAGVVVLV